ncbi:MAG TPA: 23S rRNA pseudouridine(1911/1915/1917) synthase RluD [Burkholderiales bacterium]|nr:23S rRNA pseudouridine(1911/1915/1917) synthase RluD [Burkholderiales bacterium]
MTSLANESSDYSAEDEAPIEAIIPESCAGKRLDQALAGLLSEFSRTRLKLWIEAGNVRLNGHSATPKQKVWGGERVRIEPQPLPKSFAQTPQPIPIQVVFEDASLIVIDKPAGLVVHPGSGNWESTLLNALLYRAPELASLPRAGIVHRLDKDTSGLLVVARTEAARASLSSQLAERTIKREYLALVHGEVAGSGIVEGAIGRHPTARTRMTVLARGKPARTHYSVRARFAGCTIVALELESGRTHQIRVHMQSIGHPVVGDPVYGGKPRAQSAHVRAALAAFPRQALHAERLSITHPATGERLIWRSLLPKDMRELIAALRP